MPLPPFLTIGGYDVPINTDRFEELEPVANGEIVTLFDGSLGSSITAVRRGWSGTAGPLTTAERDALYAAVPVHGRATVGGWGVDRAPGATFTAIVRRGAVRAVPTDTPDGPVALWEVPLTVREA